MFLYLLFLTLQYTRNLTISKIERYMNNGIAATFNLSCKVQDTGQIKKYVKFKMFVSSCSKDLAMIL